MYSLMETDLDVNQFLNTIYRYIQIGVHIKAYYSKEKGKFHREVDEVCEFYVDENNKPQSRILYQKLFGQEPVMRKPSPHLIEYLENQNIDISAITGHLSDDLPFKDDLEREEYMESHHNDGVANSHTNTNVTNDMSNVASASVDTNVAIGDANTSAVVNDSSNNLGVDIADDAGNTSIADSTETGESTGSESVSLPISSPAVTIAPSEVSNVVGSDTSSVNLPAGVVVAPPIDTASSVVSSVPIDKNLSQNINVDGNVSVAPSSTINTSNDSSAQSDDRNQSIVSNQAVELPSSVDFSSLDNLE